MRTESQKNQQNPQPKQAWEPMRVLPVGHIRNVIQIGGGKITAVGGDPGEPRKLQWCG
jgi:hypothetical protein